MNNELQSAIAAILNASLDSVGSAKDFAVEQAPDVVQQYLHWAFIRSILYSGLVGVLVIIMLASVVITHKLVVWARSEKAKEASWLQGTFNDNLFNAGLLLFLANLLIWVILPTVIANIGNLDWLHIWVAPKSFLLNTVVHLR